MKARFLMGVLLAGALAWGGVLMGATEFNAAIEDSLWDAGLNAYVIPSHPTETYYIASNITLTEDMIVTGTLEIQSGGTLDGDNDYSITVRNTLENDGDIHSIIIILEAGDGTDASGSPGTDGADVFFTSLSGSGVSAKFHVDAGTGGDTDGTYNGGRGGDVFIVNNGTITFTTSPPAPQKNYFLPGKDGDGSRGGNIVIEGGGIFNVNANTNLGRQAIASAKSFNGSIYIQGNLEWNMGNSKTLYAFSSQGVSSGVPGGVEFLLGSAGSINILINGTLHLETSTGGFTTSSGRIFIDMQSTLDVYGALTMISGKGKVGDDGSDGGGGNPGVDGTNGKNAGNIEVTACTDISIQSGGTFTITLGDGGNGGDGGDQGGGGEPGGDGGDAGNGGCIYLPPTPTPGTTGAESDGTDGSVGLGTFGGAAGAGGVAGQKKSSCELPATTILLSEDLIINDPWLLRRGEVIDGQGMYDVILGPGGKVVLDGKSFFLENVPELRETCSKENIFDCSDLDLTLSQDLYVNYTWTLSCNKNIWGNGNKIILEPNGEIVIDGDVAVTFNDLDVENLHESSPPNLRAITHDEEITMNNVVLKLDGTYSFSVGKLLIEGDCVIDAPNFAFQFKVTDDSNPLTIKSSASLTLLANTTFEYDTDDPNLFIFTDGTSTLQLNDATLLATQAINLGSANGVLVTEGLGVLYGTQTIDISGLSDIRVRGGLAKVGSVVWT